MALKERNSNEQMRESKQNGKRKKVEIDLTGDSEDEDAPVKKTQRNSSQPQSGRTGTSAYQTPPASSAPRSSQSFNHNHGPGRYESVYSSQPLSSTQHSEAERQSWLAEEDDDFNEIIGSTQAAAASTEVLHHYGDLPGKVVGVRFYDGYASAGEQVLLRREPGNPYDTNAIRVDNASQTQIGHIPRRVAAKLAPFMDRSPLCVEGELSGEIGTFEVPIMIRLYGPDPNSQEGSQLQADMKKEKLPLNALIAAQRAAKQREKEQKEAEKRRLQEARKAAAAGGTGNGARLPDSSQYGYANQSQAGLNAQPIMADILEAGERFSPRDVGRSTDEYGMKEEVLKQMEAAEQPKSISTKMLPYQLQARKWLLDQESPQLPPPSSKTAVQLWKRNDRHSNIFTNIATNFSKHSAPELASGGILADDMGLGKTLEIISLLLADNEKAGGKTGTTLIVAPLSVMSNWRKQIEQHVVKEHALNVYTYHGAARVQMKADDFAQYDVVITTYQTLASDYMPKGKGASSKAPERKLRSSGLYSVEWRRVILDEGHTIRNCASKGFAAVCALIAQSRWSLTGTPIVNTLKDLYSQLRFIGITGGLEQLELFNRVLVRPLKQGDSSAVHLLQAIMGAFTLRRRKDMAFIDLKLPSLDEYVQRLEFSSAERQRYDALSLEAQGMLTTYEKISGKTGKGAGEAFQNLLEILLRMRQVCNHWQLCSERVTNLLAQLEEKKTIDLTPENKKALQDILQVQIECQEDCPICLEILHNPVITTCGHFFGQDCITKVIETQSKCPMCRQELKDDSCLVQPANECGDEAADDKMDLDQSSSKLEGMMEILAASKDTKTVIFSQWTRFLDIVQARLDRDGFEYCRLDGTMSPQQRDKALTALDQDPKCKIMLASLGVCAVGLNLTAASQVILSDTWWAPAIEDQAVDRVHRLGQRKPTRVFRLVMDKTIEEATIRVQQDKRKLMRLAFSEKAGKRDNAQIGRLDDIRRLLRGEGDGAGS